MPYYDRKGNPISLDAWATLLESDRRVALTRIEPDLRVSTVWLGLDHGPDANGRSLIFETLVFRGDDSWDEIDGDRYPTEEEALRGHEGFVRKYANGRVAKS